MFDTLVEARPRDLEGVVAQGIAASQILCDGPLAAAGRLRGRRHEICRLR